MQPTTTSSDSQSFQHAFSPQVNECIEKCLECFRVCSSTIPHCLEMGGDHASPNHIGLMSACADICQTSAKAMLFNIDLKNQFCELCAQVCNQCAEECEQMAKGDQHMMSCAQACRECADACETMMQ